jgi:hypothetical protein
LSYTISRGGPGTATAARSAESATSTAPEAGSSTDELHLGGVGALRAVRA